MKRKYLLHLKKRLSEGDIKWVATNVWKYIGIPVSVLVGRPFTGPILGGIIVTYNCNYKCMFCDYYKRDNSARKVLTLPEMLSIIDDLKSLGTSGIGFSGGEPLLCKDILELIRHVKKNKMTASVGSNGSLITEKMAEDLLLTGIDMVSISIDAPFEELHDRIRGVKGSFVKALDAFSNLVKAKNKLRSQTTLVLNSVLSLQNLDYILQMPDFAANLGANSFNILGVETLAVRSDVSQRRKALEIIDDMIEKADRIVDELIKRKKQNAIIDNSISHLRLIKRQFRGEKLPIRCFAGNTSLYVDCFGDVFPCMANVELNKPVANISQQGLRQLWKTKKYQAERERLGRCRNCFFTCQNEFNVLFSVKARFLR